MTQSIPENIRHYIEGKTCQIDKTGMSEGNVYIYDDLTSAVNHIYYLDRLTDMAMIQDLHSVIESVLLS